MTAHAVRRRILLRKSRSLLLPFVLPVGVIAGAAAFVAYALWPNWPAPAPGNAPPIPITVAGVIFNVPPRAIRAGVQRHPGAHERIDLVFLWPSLAPPGADDADVAKLPAGGGSNGHLEPRNDRLFVTIAGLGAVLAPAERLRAIYPRYIETEATAGPDGLAILPFRVGTPYEGEDLVYLANKPEQFFPRCTRAARELPGTCIQERALGPTEITLRFPREWLQNWRSVAAGFDRLVGQLHAQALDGTQPTIDK